MLLELKRWVVPPGHQVQLKEVTWAELEGILEELGDRGNPRLSYSHGTLDRTTGRTALLRSFRRWVQAHRG